MAKTPQTSGGPKADSKSSDSKGEKPKAQDFQTVDLGASKGADLQVAATAPAAMASLSGFVQDQDALPQTPFVDTDQNSIDAAADLTGITSDPVPQDDAVDTKISARPSSAESAVGQSETEPFSPTADPLPTASQSLEGVQTTSIEPTVQPYSASAAATPKGAALAANTPDAVAEVDDAQKSPELSQSVAGRVAENAEEGSVVATLPATGQYGDAIVYGFTDANGVPVTSDIFQIAENQILVAPGADLDFEASDLVNLFVTATTPSGTSAPWPVSVEVYDIAEEITLGAGGVNFADEGVAETSVTGGSGADAIQAHDDGGTLTGAGGADTLVGGASSDVLTGGAGNDALSGGAGVDVAVFSGNWSDYTITEIEGQFRVVDNRDGSPDGTDTVIDVEVFRFADGDVSALDVLNDVPELTATGGPVDENEVGAVVGAVSSSDADAGDTVTYSVDDARFEVVGGHLKLKEGERLDYEADPSVDVTVTATDSHGATDTQVVTITVNDTAEAIILSDGGSTFADDGIAETSVTGGTGDDDITGHDAGANLDGGDGNDRLSTGAGDDSLRGGSGNDTIGGGVGQDIAIFSGNWSDYAITESDGVFRVSDTRAGSPDGTDTLTEVEVFRFADGDVAASDALNDAPELMVTDGTVTENDAGATIGSVGSTDANANDRVSFSVDDARFEVVDRQLKLRDGESLDFETDASVDVTVTATDSQGATDTQVVRVTVGDTAEAIILGDAGAQFTEAGVTETSVTGGAGSDTLSGADGDDKYRGSDGDDVIDGAAGNDTLSGDHGSDSVTGGAGDDDISGGSASDTLLGGTGNDALRGGTGDDTLDGGADTDVAVYDGPFSDFAVVYDANTATFTITDLNAADTDEGTDLVTGVEVFSFDGVEYTAAEMIFEADRQANTGPGRPTVSGGNVDENASVGTTVATLTATDPDGDTLTYQLTDAAGAPVSDSNFEIVGNEVRVAPGADIDFESDTSFDLFVTASDDHESSAPQAVTVTVNDMAEAIQLGNGGESFTDTGLTETSVTGGTGADAITGSDGADSLSGGAGTDTLMGGDGSDVIEGGSGGDVLIGSVGQDNLTGDSGDDTIDGGAGEDTAVYSGDFSDFAIVYDADTETFAITDQNASDGDEGTDTVTGVEVFSFAGAEYTAAEMIVEADRQANTGPGSPTVATGGDVDENAGAGTTVATLTAADTDGDTLTYQLTDAAGAPVSDSNFEIVGNEVRLAPGADINFESNTSFDLFVTASDDHETSAPQAITVTVNDIAEAITLGNVGESFTDTGVSEISVTGGNSADTITGSGGDDRIAGGAGNDSLTGDAGTDVAVFSGDWSDYTITETGGTYTVIDNRDGSPDGTDTVEGFEIFRFADGDRTPADALNDAPELTTTDGSVTENDTGAVVGAVSSSDADMGDSVAYSVDDNRFEVVDGQLKLKDGASLDYETETGVRVTVTATDSQGATDTQTVIVNVDDTSEDVTLSSGGSFQDTGIAEISITGSDDADAITGHEDGALIDGAGGDDTLVGDSGDDTLTGGIGADILKGGAGADTFVFADGFGSDTVSGGEEGFDNDTIDLQAVSDGVEAEFLSDEGGVITAGTDSIEFSEIETLVLTEGDDTVNAVNDSAGISIDLGAGNDSITDGSGADSIRAGDGDDYIAANAGDDTLLGEAGDDSIEGGGGSDIIDGGAGNDFVAGYDVNGLASQSWDAASDDGSADKLSGGDGEDTLLGGGGDDKLDGGADADVLSGGEGDDTIDGGQGSDVAVFSGNWSDYTITESGGTFTIIDNRPGSPDGTDTVSEVEVFRFADGDVSAKEALNDTPVLTANDGTIVEGDSGAVVGEVSATDADAGDSVSYSVDDARFEVVSGQLKLKDSERLDFESESRVNVTVTATDSHGAADTQVVTVAVSDTAEAITLGDGGESFTDSGVAETSITGGSGDDTITGHADGAVLDGAAGDDTVIGKDGNDTISGGAGNDRISGGVGTDVAVFSGNWSDYTITESGGTFTITDTRDGSPDGTDTVAGIETFRFADGSLAASDIMNDAPELTADDGTVGENDAGAVVGAVTSTDADAGDTVTYSVDDARFEVTGDQLKLKDGESLDFETDASVDVTITATDSQGATDRQTVTVSVADQAETISLGDNGESFTDLGIAETSIAGGTGNDTISGHEDGAVIDGGAGDDAISGNAGGDDIQGGFGDDTIAGGAGDDTLSGGENNDVLDGGEGTDVATFGGNWSDYTITESGGTYTIVDNRDGSPDGTDEVSGVETFRFADGDVGAADALNDAPELKASDGTVTENETGAVVGAVASRDPDANDSVSYSVDDARFEIVGEQLKLKDGESLDYEADGASVSVTVTATDAKGATASQTVTVTVSDVAEDVTLSDGGVSFTDAGVTETSVTGGTGNDSIYGNSGDDRLDGADGNDLLQSGSGDDELKGGAGDDRFYAGSGRDTIYGGDGNDSVGASVGSDLVYGGAGNDTISGGGYSYESDTLFGGEGDDLLTGNAGNDVIDGGAGNDVAVYSGNAADYTISESGGTFTITDNRSGRPNGADRVTGVETFRFADGDIAAADLINEAPELAANDGAVDENSTGAVVGDVSSTDANPGDRVTYSVDDARFEVVDGKLKLRDGESLDYETQSSLTVTVTATDNRGAADSQTVTVTVNDVAEDIVLDDGGASFADAGVTETSVTGGAGADKIAGTAEGDNISGSAGADTLYGRAGDDTMTGGTGDDTLAGGDGTDVAVYSGNRSDYAITESDGTLTVVDTRRGSPDGTDTASGVETFRFADGDYSASDVLTKIKVTANNKLTSGAEAFTENVVSGRIVRDDDTSSVDHWEVVHAGGDLTVDVFARGYNGSSLDSNIRLFRVEDNGDLTQIAANDDGANGNDGSTSIRDSFILEEGLAAGTYVLAIGSYFLSTSEATATGMDHPNNSSGSGAYQITFTGDADVFFATDPDVGGSWGDPDGHAVGARTTEVASELAAGTVIASADDASGADASFKFRLSDDADGAFAIDSNGDIALTGDPRASGGTYQDSISIVATDAMGSTTTEDLGVTFGSTESDVLTGSTANDAIFGFEGLDTFSGGAGDDTMIGGEDDIRTVNVGDNGVGTTGYDAFTWEPSVGESATIRFNNTVAAGDADGVQDYVQIGNTNDSSLMIGDFDLGTDRIVLPEAWSTVSMTASDGMTQVSLVYPDGGEQTFTIYHEGTAVSVDDFFTTETPGDTAIYAGDLADFSIDYDPESSTFTITDQTIDDGLDEGTDTVSGIDTFVFGGVSYSQTDLINYANASLTTDDYDAGFAEAANYDGTAGYDEFTGSSGGEVYYGRGGDDDLYGQGGNDTIYAGSGNDWVEGGDGADRMYGGTGNDDMNGDAGADTIYGGAGADTLHGNNDDDVLYGGADNDEVYGGSGNNQIFGGDGADYLVGGGDQDTIFGGTGNDTFYGNDGADVLSGGAGADLIYANAGDDTLMGGHGDDTLYGHEGADVFAIGVMEGDDEVFGGTDGWTDIIDLQGMGDGATVSGSTVTGEGWTMLLDNGHSVTGQTLDTIELTDASGVITFDDGGTIDFAGIDRIAF